MERAGGRPVARWTRLDTLLAGLLAVAALGVRLPELLTLPAFRDELAEVVRGLHIYRGQAYPLTNEALDIGALFNYLVALLFVGSGPDPYLPRLLVTGFGAATVALTYALARALTGSRLAAVLAGAFLAANVMHILIGHVAWSDCMTPFWTTALLLALATGTAPATPNRLPRTPALLVAGLLAGLALQTHSSVVVFLAGLAVWLCWPGRDLWARLRRPAFWGAGGLFLAGYANMIVFNIVDPLASWYHVVEHKGYALAGAMTGSGTVALGAGYPANLGALLLEWLRANSAAFTRYDDPLRYLADPALLVYAALLAAGAGLAVRRRLWLLLASVLSSVLMMPLFNRDYQFEIHTRYIGFLLPLGAILLALPVAATLGRLAAHWPERARGPIAFRPAWAAAPVALALVLYPLPALAHYYAGEEAAGRSNVGVIATLARFQPLRDGGAAAYTSTIPEAMSVGLGLDVWEIPHLELSDGNDPRLPPGAGGLDTPAVWRAFLAWAGRLPPGTRALTVAVPPAAAGAWQAIGAGLPWSAPVLVRGSDGAPVAAVFDLPLPSAGLLAQPAAQLDTDLLLVVPRLGDALAPGARARLTAAQAGGQVVRVFALAGDPGDPATAPVRAALLGLGLPAGRILWGGYPPAFLAHLAAVAGSPSADAPWTDPASGQATTRVTGAPSLHGHLFAAEAPLSAPALRGDLRAAVVLYAPGRILAPPATAADPLAAAAGQVASYAARKTGTPLQTLP